MMTSADLTALFADVKNKIDVSKMSIEEANKGNYKHFMLYN